MEHTTLQEAILQKRAEIDFNIAEYKARIDVQLGLSEYQRYLLNKIMELQEEFYDLIMKV